MRQKRQLPKDYSTTESGDLTSLYREGLLVFYSFRPVGQKRIDQIIAQIEAAQEWLRATW